MAQDDFSLLVGAVERAESGGRRYDRSGQLLTSPKGAQGEMQVMPRTQRDPGFGVTPARQNSPDEIARVGRDYLKAMVDRYGNREHALVAYNWGPGNADKWIAAGANPAKLPKETRDYVARVDRFMAQGTQQANVSRETKRQLDEAPARAFQEAIDRNPSAQAPTTPATPAPTAPEAPDISRETRLADLGPSYQAALALSVLADEDLEERRNRDVDDDTQPSVAQKWLMEQGSRPTALAEFADLRIRSPFPEEPPVQMADGGEVMSEEPVGYNKGGEVEEPNVLKVPLYSETVAYEMYPGQGGQFDQRDAARHMLAAGTLARKYGPTAAEMLGKLHEIGTSPMRFLGSKLGISEMPVDYEQDLHNNRIGIELGRRAKSQKELEDLVQQMAEQAEKQKTEGKPWVGRPQKPVKRRDGSPPTGEQADLTRPATVNPNIRRQGEAARRLAALRDVNTLPDPRTYAAVSGFFGVPPDEQGFSVLHPDLAGIKKAGERGFVAGTVAQVAPMAAAIRGLGSGAKTTAQQMLAGMKDIPVGMAVKPKGGTFMPREIMESDFQGSDLANTMNRYMEAAGQKGLSPEAIEFLQTKALKYFTTTYGTADDPLRTAIRERRLEPFGTDRPAIPPYMVDVAADPSARGFNEARRDLERAYDLRTGITAKALLPEKVAKNIERYSVANKLQEQARQKMAAEGVPNEFINQAPLDTYSVSMFEEYPTSTRTLSELVQQQKAGTLPENLVRALQSGEMIYDVSPRLNALYPEQVADAIAQIPPNKLKNMSFVDAIVEGNKRLEPIRNYQAAIEMAERGARVPKQVLFQYTKPVLPMEDKKWVQLTDPLASEMEGKLMKHSVGGYGYGDSYNRIETGLPVGGKEAFDKGLVRLYSLRDESGLPTTTVEIAKSNAGKGDDWNVIQIRGRFNSEPADKEAVFNLLDKLDKDVGLGEIRRNSYIRADNGESIPGTVVDWGQEYMNWKAGTE